MKTMLALMAIVPLAIAAQDCPEKKGCCGKTKAKVEASTQDKGCDKAQDKEGCCGKDNAVKQQDGCCGEAKAKAKSSPCKIALKNVKEGCCKDSLAAALSKKLGHPVSANGSSCSVELKDKVFLSQISAALAETCKDMATSCELDEAAIPVQCAVVVFEGDLETLKKDHPEFAFAKCPQGAPILLFGTKTPYTVADVRKIGKVKDVIFGICSEGKCDSNKTSSGCGECPVEKTKNQ